MITLLSHFYKNTKKLLSMSNIQNDFMVNTNRNLTDLQVLSKITPLRQALKSTFPLRVNSIN